MSGAVAYAIIRETDKYMLLRDLSEGIWALTITNGAEIIVDELVPRLNGRRLLYIDTDGTLDELLIKDGKFAGFKTGSGVVAP